MDALQSPSEGGLSRWKVQSADSRMTTMSSCVIETAADDAVDATYSCFEERHPAIGRSQGPGGPLNPVAPAEPIA